MWPTLADSCRLYPPCCLKLGWDGDGGLWLHPQSSVIPVVSFSSVQFAKCFTVLNVFVNKLDLPGSSTIFTEGNRRLSDETLKLGPLTRGGG